MKKICIVDYSSQKYGDPKKDEIVYVEEEIKGTFQKNKIFYFLRGYNSSYPFISPLAGKRISFDSIWFVDIEEDGFADSILDKVSKEIEEEQLITI